MPALPYGRFRFERPETSGDIWGKATREAPPPPKVTSTALPRSQKIFLTSFPTVPWTPCYVSHTAVGPFRVWVCALPVPSPRSLLPLMAPPFSESIFLPLLSKVVPPRCRCLFNSLPCLISLHNTYKHVLGNKFIILPGYSLTTPLLSRVEAFCQIGTLFCWGLYPQGLVWCLAYREHTVIVI